MKTTLSSRLTPSRRAPRLGRAAAGVALGLIGLFAPSTQAQTNTTGCFAAPAGLVGWWRAEGDAADFTGANSGSFPFGSAFTTGLVGQAFDFDGSSRRVSIPDSPALQLTNAMTLEAWVYPRAYGGFITFRGDNRGGLDNWTLDTYDTGFVKFSLHDPANNAVSLRAALALNQWQHVAATWDRTAGDLKIYINGTLSAQTNSPLVPIGTLDPAYEPAIGIGNHGGTFHQFPFNGLIDELGIYNRALNSNEITAIVAAGSAGKCLNTNQPPLPGPPVITGFTPATAVPGSQVIIAGRNFSPVAASNTVYFGATKAVIVNALTNQLVVTVPTGATFAPPTVTVNGLTAAAQAAFTPTFAGTGEIASTNFAPRFSLGTGTGPTQTAIADFDGDGKPDLAVTDDYADSISVYRNISPGGGLTGSHFEPRIVVPASTANYSPYLLIAGDVDGDGRLDLVASDVDGNTVSVFRNQATPGSLSSNSFAPFVTFAVGASPRAVALADLDGDGRPEIVTANYGSSTVSILRNVSSPGTITTTSFASRVDFAVGAGPQGLVVTDLDGDGQSDIATGNSSSHSLSLLRNLGTGTITSNLFAAAVTFSGPNYVHFLKAIELDGDGRPELLASSYLGQSVSLYRNQAAPGGFTSSSFALLTAPALSGRGHTLACGDLNGDGQPDIAIDTELADSVALFQNIHTSGDVTAASLGARVDLPAGWNAWGSSIGDLDGDNRPDIVVANTYDNTISVYQNLAAMNTNPPSPSGWLLSVDFGADLNGKTGFAALGQTTNDVWNFYSRNDGAGGWRTFGVLPNLITVDGTVTPVGMTVANAPGAWGNGSPDAMYDDYIYPFNGGNVTVTVTNLPAGQYDLLAYAYDGNFELTSGGVSHGVQTTRDNIRTNAPVWAAGIHYAHFTNVSVAGGQPLVLTVRPGLDAYAVISGLQLSASLTTNTVPGTNPPAGNCVAVPTGAISWWRGEGSALDDIRSNNGSVVGGVTTVPGKVGNGFGFDGTGYIVVPHHPSLNNSNALTIELWYQATPNANSDYGLIDKRVGFTGANFGINVIAGAGLGAYYDDLTVQDGDDLGSSFETSRYTPIPAPGVFHHLAATYWQFSNNVVRIQIYLNGQNVRTRYIAGNLANTINTTPLTIGATAQGAGEFFQGVIDEVTLYNRVLSATEIQSIYAADTAGKCAPAENLCFTPPAGLVSWWRAEGNAADSTSVNHGTLTGAANYTSGRIGQAFDFDGDRDGVSAGTATNLQLQDFTVEAWIKRRSDSVISFNGNGNGQLFSVGAGGGGSTFYLQADSRLALGKLQVNVVTSDAMVTDTNWHHIAVTKQGTTVRFFVDGVAYAAPAYDSGGFTFNGPAYIGAWLNPSQLVDNTFFGAIDEMAVYNRALTTNEIAALYNASADGKCVPASTPPVITQHPQDTVAIAGGTAQFEVGATGVPAPSYQWYFQNDPLPGQTNPTLVLDNVFPDKQGTYSVLVSNPGGSLFSSNATLTVVTTQAVVLVDGTTSGFYNEALGTILDGTAPQFPLPFGQGDDPTFFPADEPNLAAATNILGQWLAAPPALNSNWQAVAVIPDTWALNTETAIIYPVNAGSYGIADLRGDFDADNGIYVWVNGQFKFGARQPGLPSPIGQFEYPNVSLGSLPPGTNYIQILREDSGITAGSQIRFTGTVLSTNRQSPTIVQSPTNQTVAAGSSVSFTVAAEGTPLLAYQWRFEGADLAGQTSSTLSLLNVQPARAGNYSVLVSNAYGSVTSSVATLTVLTYPPTITSQPQDRGGYEGQSVSFTVGATGTATLRYQWSRNGTNLPNATAATLTVPNLQSNLTGFYQVIVTNAYGTATSRLAQLTVLPPPPCTPAPDGVIAWWPGQSNHWDVIGGFDATPYQSLPNYLLYTTGKVGAALNLGAVQNYAVVRTGGGLNVNAGSGLTIEGWVRPNSLSGFGPVAEWSDGRSTVGAGLLINSGGPGTIEATLTDTNLTKSGVTLRSAIYAVTNGLWQHVALTFNKSNGLATIYVNGSVVAQTNVGSLTPTTSGDVYLGYRPVGMYTGSRFNGTLDEITLYNRALAPEEVQAIVAADFIGKCPPLPPACVTPPADIVAWWRGESNTVDLVAGNDAIRIPTNYTAALAYQTGQIGMAFRFNLQNTLSVPRSESLDVGTGNGLTVEGWIYPATLSPMPIVEWTDTNSYGANLWLSYSRGPTVLEANLIDTAGRFHLIRSPVNTIRGYSWQHVAVTYDKTTGIAALYSDGALVVSTNLGFFTPRTSTELQIGFHPRATTGGGDGAPPTSDYRFNGAMDELAIYRRSLTAAEIRNVARPRPGKCLELPPTLSQQPQPQIGIEGGSAQFAVKAGGTAPLQYQWLFAGQPIGGATNASLALLRLDLANAGLYSVRISNLFGTATSRAADLNVLPANQCLPTPYGAVAFWRGESNIVDELGRHSAQWGSNTLPVYSSGPKDGGMVGTAFRFNGANHLQIPSDADLNVSAGGGFTIEGWVKPDSLLAGSQPIWDWSDSRGNLGVGLMLGRTSPGALEVTLTDTNATSTIERIITLTTPAYTIGSPTNTTSRWFHIALTFDKAAQNVALYVDGRLVAERSVPMVYYGTPIYDYRLFGPATTGNLYFGWRPFGTGANARFRGALDEMSVYYRALTPLELQALYLVGANGKCSPAPTCQTFNPSIVSWWRGESNVLDSVDGNHGLSSPLAGPGISYTNGIVGLGFKTSSSRYVQVPASPSLNVGAGSGLTFDTWFKLDGTVAAPSTFALASWNLGSTQGVYIGTSPTRGVSYLEANLVDTAGVSHTILLYNNLPLGTGIQPWHHLAVTYDKPSGQAIFYLNGSPVIATNLGSFTPRTTGQLNLGFRPQTNVGGASLNGTLDETTLYNRALTSSEITANYRNVANRCMEPPVIVQAPQSVHVNPGSNVTFTVVAAGSPLLRYQWGKMNGPITLSPLPGQTNVTLSLTNVQAKDSGSYWIRVTNAFGSATSSNIQLVVNVRPTALSQTVTTAEDSPRSFTLLASDANQDLLVYTVLTQPTNGTLVTTSSNLVYTPLPNFFGADSLTFKVNDGLLDSLPATVSILVTPVNDPPTAGSQLVSTDEDMPLPLTLAAVDADGDVLTFQITPPTHGTLSGIAPNLVYTPHANYFGDDLFTYTVKDGSNAVSELAAISITVRPVNDTPVARMELAPLDELPGITNLVSIAPVCCAATLRLDASQSSDVENEPLSYAWVIGTNVISSDAVVTNRLAPGTYEITLIVSDGATATSQTRTVELLTANETVDYLTQLVEAGVTSRNLRSPLLNWLRETGKSFDRCHVEQGIHFLELFRDRVADRLKPTDPELAQSLMDTATAIIEAAPDCDPCHRLGRKDRKHGRDKDRDDRDGRDDRDRQDNRDDDRNNHRADDRNSDGREQNGRAAKSEQEAAPAQDSQAEMRPGISETGAERTTKSRQ